MRGHRRYLRTRENAMTTHVHRHQPIHDGLHPLVYRALIGLAVWLVAVDLDLFRPRRLCGPDTGDDHGFLRGHRRHPAPHMEDVAAQRAGERNARAERIVCRLGIAKFRHLDRRPERPRRGDADPACRSRRFRSGCLFSAWCIISTYCTAVIKALRPAAHGRAAAGDAAQEIILYDGRGRGEETDRC